MLQEGQGSDSHISQFQAISRFNPQKTRKDLVISCPVPSLRIGFIIPAGAGGRRFVITTLTRQQLEGLVQQQMFDLCVLNLERLFKTPAYSWVFINTDLS